MFTARHPHTLPSAWAPTSQPGQLLCSLCHLHSDLTSLQLSQSALEGAAAPLCAVHLWALSLPLTLTSWKWGLCSNCHRGLKQSRSSEHLDPTLAPALHSLLPFWPLAGLGSAGWRLSSLGRGRHSPAMQICIQPLRVNSYHVPALRWAALRTPLQPPTAWGACFADSV